MYVYMCICILGNMYVCWLTSVRRSPVALSRREAPPSTRGQLENERKEKRSPSFQCGGICMSEEAPPRPHFFKLTTCTSRPDRRGARPPERPFSRARGRRVGAASRGRRRRWLPWSSLRHGGRGRRREDGARAGVGADPAPGGPGDGERDAERRERRGGAGAGGGPARGRGAAPARVHLRHGAGAVKLPGGRLRPRRGLRRRREQGLQRDGPRVRADGEREDAHDVRPAGLERERGGVERRRPHPAGRERPLRGAAQGRAGLRVVHADLPRAGLRHAPGRGDERAPGDPRGGPERGRGDLRERPERVRGPVGGGLRQPHPRGRGEPRDARDAGRERAIQRRFNVGVFEATPERKASTL